uniref:Small ribosomal subunit protein uS7c n=1 Tax=Koshicola spirodelophila TaxID=1707787 RepID=A0A167MGX0_9CHLO|nr:ribosomal protein S7 [Koshicola spirodelophila]
MSRKGNFKKRSLFPDPIYNRISVHMLVNRVLKNGKKSIAYRIVYSVLQKLSTTTEQNPVEIWEQALNNVKPRVEVKPRRRAGAIQQVPRIIRSADKAQAVAIRWILGACLKRSGKDMISKLYSEISDAYKKSGMAFRKKEELHKIALANQMNARRPETIVQAIMDTESDFIERIDGGSTFSSGSANIETLKNKNLTKSESGNAFSQNFRSGNPSTSTTNKTAFNKR